MRTILNYTVAALFACLLTNKVMAQQEMSAFTVTGSGLSSTLATDYLSIGINPSNLGWKNERNVHIGFLENGTSLYSDALKKENIRNNFFKASGYKEGNFTREQKVEAGQEFANKGLQLNSDLGIIGFAYQSELLGGIAFSARERISSSVKLNETFADILFNGRNAAYFDTFAVNNGDTTGIASQVKNISQLTDGSHIQFTWYREFNLSYGRRIWSNDETEIYAGVGARYIMGFGIMNVEARDGKLTAYSALSPVFDIKYGQSGLNIDTSGGLKQIGQGYGFDLGLSAKLNKKITVAASVTNLGSITWSGNAFEVQDTALASMASKGINSYNVFTESEALVGENGVFKWKNVNELKVALPASFRAGANYAITDDLKAGLEMTLPFNQNPGSLRKPLVTAGGEIRLLKIVRISTGMSVGGSYGFNIPFGIVVSPNKGVYEAGIATRDITSYFSQNNPNLSFAFGFLRFGI